VGINVGRDLPGLEGRCPDCRSGADGQGSGVASSVRRRGLAAIKGIVDRGSLGLAGNRKLEGFVAETTVGIELGVRYEGLSVRLAGIGVSGGRGQKVTGGPAAEINADESGLKEKVAITRVKVGSLQGENIVGGAQGRKSRGGIEISRGRSLGICPPGQGSCILRVSWWEIIACYLNSIKKGADSVIVAQ